jgi:membrane-bound metal-dependent hydrolase YbcI (DUF457 family)
MPTIFTHAVTAAALKTAFPTLAVPRRLIALGAVCAMAPDADVIGSRFGIEYGDLFGHRGITHSILFAICFSLAAVIAGLPYVAGFGRQAVLWVYLFLATVSHGLLDACTDGGLGSRSFRLSTPRVTSSARVRSKLPLSGHISFRSVAFMSWEASLCGCGFHPSVWLSSQSVFDTCIRQHPKGLTRRWSESD